LTNYFVNVAKKLPVNNVVLDASAVLAVFFAEEGRQAVEPVLFGASMSAVNYSEVLKKAVEKRGSLTQAKFFLERQSIQIVPFDASQGEIAAAILPKTSPLGLSFADRACLTLGMQLQYKVFTAEHRMGDTELDVKVKLIRKRPI
jgi:ribonuclease VapC